MRKCFVCGVGHLARNCQTRAAQAANLASLINSSNAVASAGNAAAQVFIGVEIGGVRISDALGDTGSAFSMLSKKMYIRLPSASANQPLTRSSPDIVGVGGASAEVRGYVVAPVELGETAVHHPLLVVEGLAFPLLIGTDIFWPHSLIFTLGKATPLRLRTRV